MRIPAEFMPSGYFLYSRVQQGGKMKQFGIFNVK
jgi:hypothetical protein